MLCPLDKEMIHVLGRTEQDFIMIFRMVHNLKLMNYLFLKFSI